MLVFLPNIHVLIIDTDDSFDAWYRRFTTLCNYKK